MKAEIKLTDTHIVDLIPSPCIRSCCLDDNNTCLGCFRSLDEICQWTQADKRARQTILNNCQRRRRDYHTQPP
ncbi:MAG: DUF1289 domain-containing protein [Methylococcales bacterium]|nr:DUF1289 domain-containing protein [Methylococcales bacterium]